MRAIFNTVLVLGILALLCCVAFPPMPGGIKRAPQSSCMQTAHALGLAIYSYGNDNDGNYPDGKSSTEVFQKLIDGGYVTDPAIFYVQAAGKVKAISGQKLKPENVCWDVTSGLTNKSSPELPVLFLTGYRVNYVPGGSAVPITKPYPQFGGAASRDWSQWWNNERTMPDLGPGIAVYYMNNSARWTNPVTAPAGDISIPQFISPDYTPDGKTYRQLTPEGTLPP